MTPEIPEQRASTETFLSDPPFSHSALARMAKAHTRQLSAERSQQINDIEAAFATGTFDPEYLNITVDLL